MTRAGKCWAPDRQQSTNVDCCFHLLPRHHGQCPPTRCDVKQVAVRNLFHGFLPSFLPPLIHLAAQARRPFPTAATIAIDEPYNCRTATPLTPCLVECHHSMPRRLSILLPCRLPTPLRHWLPSNCPQRRPLDAMLTPTLISALTQTPRVDVCCLAHNVNCLR